MSPPIRPNLVRNVDLPPGETNDRTRGEPRRMRLRPAREPGGVLFMIFAALMLLVSNDAVFECKRTDALGDGACTLTQQFVYASSTETYDLADIVRLDMEVGESARIVFFLRTYDAEMNEDELSVPLSGQFIGLGYEKRKKEVERFNAFLSHPSIYRASIREGALLWVALLAFFLGAVGLHMTFGNVRYVDCEVDENDRSLQIRYRGWFFPRHSRIGWEEISGIEIESKTALFNSWHRCSESVREEDVRYRLVLVPTSGQPFVLISPLRVFADVEGLRKELLEMTASAK